LGGVECEVDIFIEVDVLIWVVLAIEVEIEDKKLIEGDHIGHESSRSGVIYIIFSA
jgi:hypothetical protein